MSQFDVITTNGPSMLAIIFPVEGEPRVAYTADRNADVFARIVRELDPEWCDLLAHAFELAGMPPLDDDGD